MATLSPDLSSDFRPASERRRNSRFPFREEVRYRVLKPKGDHTCGTGKTLNIGSGGILFTTKEKIPLGRNVEVAVAWPACLDGMCPLQFVAIGPVVRSECNRAAVRIERYEFKTRRIAASTPGPTLVK